MNGDFDRDLLRKVTEDMAMKVKEEATVKALAKDDSGMKVKIDMVHENRWNSNNSTLTAIDVGSNEIVVVSNISRGEQSIAQKHEADATEKMCLEVKRQGRKITLAIVDQGSSARAVILRHFPDCCVQWDDWHALKNLEKKLNTVLGQTNCYRDKIVSIRSHVYWCLRNYKISLEDYGDSEKRREAIKKLQDAILNVTRHYQGGLTRDVDENGDKYHGKCSATSRCQSQPNYVLNKDLLNREQATLLFEVLKETVFIKSTEKFLLGGNTSNVESSHRGQNVYRYY